VEAMRTIYRFDLIPTHFPDVEMTINIPEAEEVAFTLVNNKKHKRKSKVSSLFSISSSDSKSKIFLISQTPLFSKL